MILDRPRNLYDNYQIDKVPGNFSVPPDGIEVSTHAFHRALEPYENSWGTMVTLRTPTNSAAKETSLLTLSHFL